MPKKRGQNEGSIFRRKDGRWVGQVRIENKNTVKYFQTQREAREWVKQMTEQIQAGLSLSGSQQITGEYLKQWLTIVQTTIRPKTFDQYRYVVHLHLIPTIGQIKLRELRPEHVQTLLNNKLQSGCSNRTVILIHGVLHRALNMGLKLGLVVRNVSDAVTKPRLAHKEMMVLDDIQVRNLLLAAKDNGCDTFLQVAITTGMRLGEILGLRWSDLDWSTRKIQINRQVGRINRKGLVFSEPKTAAGRRSIKLGAATIQKLQEHYQAQQVQKGWMGDKWQDNNLVFPNSIGRPMEHSNVLKIFREILAKAGLPPIRFHDLRHTAATLMLKEGINPKIVQERLGHSDITLTLNTYSHVLPSMQDEVAEKLDELVTLVPIQEEITQLPARQNK